jgi:hypothetical protein
MGSGSNPQTRERFGVFTPFAGSKRLSEATRDLAARYISGEIGRSVKPAEFALAPEFPAADPTPNRHYAAAVRLIAAQAPLRILPGERLAGKGTLANTGHTSYRHPYLVTSG